MKNKLFTGLTLAPVLSVSAFFCQPATAQSKAKPVLCKVKKNNAGYFVEAMSFSAARINLLCAPLRVTLTPTHRLSRLIPQPMQSKTKSAGHKLND